MGYERTAWFGNVLLAAVMVFLAWAQVSAQLTKWTTAGIAVAVVLYVIAVYPRKRADGSPARLIDSFGGTVRGNHNRVQIARDNANQVMGSGQIKSGTADDE